MTQYIDTYLGLLDKVEAFRKATGLPLDSGSDCDIAVHKAVTLEELTEAADGLTDSLVTLAGIALDGDVANCITAESACARMIDNMERMGFNSAVCIDIVNNANMSKICDTVDIANRTKSFYLQLGVDSEIKELDGGKYALYCAETTTAKDGKFYPAKKLLKSIYWHEPDWSDYKSWMKPYLYEAFEG